MSDADLRAQERNYDDREAEAAHLRALARTNGISEDVFALFAFIYQSPAAQFVQPDFREIADLSILKRRADEGDTAVERETRTQIREDILSLVAKPELNFGEIPNSLKLFFNRIFTHDFEARQTLAHYELIEEGDTPPPSPATALQALAKDLRENPSHMEAINQMHKPTLQLIPVFDRPGAGFQRMVTAIDTHPIPGQTDTFINPNLQTRWQTNTRAPAKIIGWQVAVTEGEKILPEDSNPHRNELIEEQYRLWEQDCEERGTTFAGNISYALLSAQKLRQPSPETPLAEAGIDPYTDTNYSFTILKDSTRQPGSLVPYGNWRGGRVYFFEFHPERPCANARFRSVVVVEV